MMHLNEQPVTLSQSVLGKEEFSADLEALVQRLLEKDPDRRYQSMEELHSSLGRLLSDLPLERVVESQLPRKIDGAKVIVGAVAALLVAFALGSIGFYFGNRVQTARVDTDNTFTQVTDYRKDMSQSESEMYKQVISENVRRRLPVLDLSTTTKALPIANNDLEPLKDASNAVEINITGAHIDDRGLENIGGLKLRKLNLCRTDVKDLHALKDMYTLAHLEVAQTGLNSKGMQTIGHLKNLQVLNISLTGISDDDLDQLLSLPKLSRLWIVGCSHLTPSAVEHLQKRLPNCVFIPSVNKFRELQSKSRP